MAAVVTLRRNVPVVFPSRNLALKGGALCMNSARAFVFWFAACLLCIGSFERMMDLSILALFSLNEFETRTSSIRSRTKLLVFLMFARTYSLKSGAGAASRLAA